jgi:peroxiredoxin Q/BCP
MGQPVPDFSAAATGDRTVRSSDLRGRRVVVYFYPNWPQASADNATRLA